MNPPISRRTFLKGSAALGIISAACARGLGGAIKPATERAGWVDRPMRWAQLTLVEDDPGQYDPSFWLDYFRRTFSDGACLSAGGCVAYYPTRVPFHHRSAWLGDRDVLGELITGCRRLGMAVLARTDPHATYQDVYEAHPDWIAIDEQGRPRKHWASPEMWVTCGLGPYNFEFMTAVMKEIAALYQPDGFFINRWEGSGICFCRHCQANFHAASGFDLPRASDPHDPARRSYLAWRQQRLFQLWDLWQTEIKKINARAEVIPNTGGGALSFLDMKRTGEIAPMLVADRQARRGVTPPWGNGKNGKEYRAVMGRKPIIGLFSVGLEEPYRWKDSVQDPAEIRIWVLDGIANGLRPWFSKFSGTLHDQRWLKEVERLYGWHHRFEKYLRHERPLARVGLVYSQQTAQFYGGERAKEKVEDHALGFYQALIEARIPFEMVHDQLLQPARLRPFKTLILPNIAALSDLQCRQLRDYVRQGGSLVATYETSLYLESGERREDFGLSDLFGVSFRGRVEGPMRNSYLQLNHPPGPRTHPLLRGLEQAPRIINGTYRVEVQGGENAGLPLLGLIPSYPDLPMEKVYPRLTAGSGHPELYYRQEGESRVVYFPWDIDRIFWEVLSADHGKLLRNAVAWATAEEMPVTVHGPGVLDVTGWSQESSLTVHLVNLTNPMMMKGPFRESIPVGPQLVRLRLPDGTKPRRVHLLVSEKSPRVRRDRGFLEVTVPGVVDHEVVAVDL